jgi:hypothetical protein
LQAFTDYAFGGKIFGVDEIGKQIKASRDAATDGWMLWNPRNVYSTNDIKPDWPDGKAPATDAKATAVKATDAKATDVKGTDAKPADAKAPAPATR